MECASALLISAGGDVVSAIASGMIRQKKPKASAIFQFIALSCCCMRRESICRCPCPSSTLTGASDLPPIWGTRIAACRSACSGVPLTIIVSFDVGEQVVPHCQLKLLFLKPLFFQSVGSLQVHHGSDS